MAEDDSNKPLTERDVIPIKREGQSFESVAVNANYILKTGDIPYGTGKSARYTIDWRTDDAFTRSMQQVERNALYRIQQWPTEREEGLRELLGKPNWDKADREKWESGLSQIVSEETARVPGLANYRTAGKGGYLPPGTRTDAVDIRKLNDLSRDISQSWATGRETEKYRFDCAIQSAVEISTLQKIENGLLPPRAGEADYKKASPYFLVGGDTVAGGYGGNHASIFTPAGNMIEATAKENVYKRSLYNDSTLQQLVAGRAFFTKFGNSYQIYAARVPGKDVTPGEVVEGVVRDRAATLTMSDAATSREAIYLGSNRPNTLATEAEDGLIALSSRLEENGKAYYQLSVYQEQMKGTSQHGWYLLSRGKADAAPDGKPQTLARDFTDVVTGHTFHVNSTFSGNEVHCRITRDKETFDRDALLALRGQNGYAVAEDPKSGLIAVLMAGESGFEVKAFHKEGSGYALVAEGHPGKGRSEMTVTNPETGKVYNFIGIADSSSPRSGYQTEVAIYEGRQGAYQQDKLASEKASYNTSLPVRAFDLVEERGATAKQYGGLAVLTPRQPVPAAVAAQPVVAPTSKTPGNGLAIPAFDEPAEEHTASATSRLNDDMLAVPSFADPPPMISKFTSGKHAPSSVPVGAAPSHAPSALRLAQNFQPAKL
jgi:hypothetical protein